MGKKILVVLIVACIGCGLMFAPPGFFWPGFSPTAPRTPSPEEVKKDEEHRQESAKRAIRRLHYVEDVRTGLVYAVYIPGLGTPTIMLVPKESVAKDLILKSDVFPVKVP